MLKYSANQIENMNGPYKILCWLPIIDIENFLYTYEVILFFISLLLWFLVKLLLSISSKSCVELCNNTLSGWVGIWVINLCSSIHLDRKIENYKKGKKTYYSIIFLYGIDYTMKTNMFTNCRKIVGSNFP